jgi:hypothetical protein
MSKLQGLRVAVLVLAWSGSFVMADGPTAADGREQLVARFIEAFNAQDVDGMAKLVTDDVQWLSVDGTSVAVETGTKQQLVVSMGKYFKSCPSCRSSLSGVIATADRLSAIEVARWESAKGKKEQRGISVYEFSGPLIRRVYYFPVER